MELRRISIFAATAMKLLPTPESALASVHRSSHASPLRFRTSRKSRGCGRKPIRASQLLLTQDQSRGLRDLRHSACLPLELAVFASGAGKRMRTTDPAEGVFAHLPHA